MALSGHAQTLLTRLSDTFKAEYEPQKVLGEGAMGVVVSARQASLDRSVAIKFLLCFSDADALNRFGREAQLSSLLDHPRIVRLFTSGIDGELPFIVYEFVEGRTLKDLIDEGPLPASQALTLGTQLFEGLEHAHSQKIVHRDLKPANVLIAKDGSLKITDYGIGSSLTIEWALTRTGTLMGTPAYMAPEQWSAATTMAADIYSGGVVLSEMLLGRNPFVRPTMIGTRNAHVHEPRTPLGPGFDSRYDELLDLLLAKEPDARPSATQVLERLEDIRARRTPRAKPVSVPPAINASGGAAGLGSTGGARKSSRGAITSSLGVPTTQPAGGKRRTGLTVAIALVIFLLGLVPFLRSTAQLSGMVTAVAGSRAAALALECGRPATPDATVEPAVPGLTVKAVDKDGARRRWTLTLAGLEPGVSYRVQPLLDGRPAGPVVPVTTLGGPDQVASIAALTFTDPHTLSVRFRSPLPCSAALSVSTSTPSEWVPGAAGELREVRVSGLDPARSHEPVILFDGLPETVPLGAVPGVAKVVERARRTLVSAVGGPAFADRQALLRRIASRAQKRVVTPEKVREACERHVREATGLSLDLVLSAAQVAAANEASSIADRWSAREVLDGLLVLESIGHPWCQKWVIDVASHRSGVPRWEWVGKVPRPPEAPPLTAWVPPGKARDHIVEASLPLWTHRERNLESIFLLNEKVAASFAVERELARYPHWAWLTPPAPPDRGADAELVLKVYNIVEDQLLWVRFGGRFALAVPPERGTRPMRAVGHAPRKANARGLRITIPMEIWRDTQGIEVRVDGFQATESAPVADECWIADAWLVQ